MVKVNDLRKVVAHASRGGMVTLAQLEELEGYQAWLRNQISAVDDGIASGAVGDDTGETIQGDEEGEVSSADT
jgi:hypothetical protein